MAIINHRVSSIMCIYVSQVLCTSEKLSSFSFDPKAYALGGFKAIHEHAQSLMQDALGREPSDEERQSVRDWVHLLYDDLKRNSAGELSVPEGGLYTGGIVTCDVGGTSIKGRVSFSPKHLSVGLLGAKPNPRTGVRMMMLAPYIFTEEPRIGSAANELCIHRIKKLLVDLYYDYLMLRDAVPKGAQIPPDVLQECTAICNPWEIIHATD